MASTARNKRFGKLWWIAKMISSSRALTLYIPFFDQLQKKFQVFSRFLVERFLKICKKILKIWKKSGTRVNTWAIQKKRPKKSWTSKKIQTHEFVLKNNYELPPAACGRRWVALRATWGVWRPPHDLGRNKYSDPVITNPTPLLPFSQKSRGREEEEELDFF